MEAAFTKVKKPVLKMAIIATAIPDLGQGGFSPIVEKMSQSMPGVSPTLIQMTVSMPLLALALCSVFYGESVRKWKKRTLLKIGFVLFFAGGLGPAVLNNIYLILLCRILIGMAAAIMMPITVDLISDFFSGREQRAMIGYGSSVSQLGAMIFVFLGGLLGNINWHFAALSCLFAAPFFIFSLIFLPEPDVDRSKMQTFAGAGKKGISMKVLSIAVFIVFMDLVSVSLVTYSSVMVVGEGISNTAVVGYMQSVCTGAALIVSILFDRISEFFHGKTLVPGVILQIAGVLIFSFSSVIPLLFAGEFLFGLGYGILVPSVFSYLTNAGPAEAKSSNLSCGYMARGIGGFVTPFFFLLMNNLFNTSFGRDSMKICLAVTVIMLAASLLISRKMVFNGR